VKTLPNLRNLPAFRFKYQVSQRKNSRILFIWPHAGHAPRWIEEVGRKTLPKRDNNPNFGDLSFSMETVNVSQQLLPIGCVAVQLDNGDATYSERNTRRIIRASTDDQKFRRRSTAPSGTKASAEKVGGRKQAQ
jgi:hypothetical protein